MAVKVELTKHGEVEWVSADAMDRQVKRVAEAERQRDELLSAIQPFLLGDPPAARSPEQRSLYELAERIEQDKQETK